MCHGNKIFDKQEILTTPHRIKLFFLSTIQFPGWMVNSEGSVFIATANDNAVGMYTCTPYNSYGTMGQSEPTQVILQVIQVSTRLVTLLHFQKESHSNLG